MTTRAVRNLFLLGCMSVALTVARVSWAQSTSACQNACANQEGICIHSCGGCNSSTYACCNSCVAQEQACGQACS